MTTLVEVKIIGEHLADTIAPATAIVISNDAPAAVKDAARKAQCKLGQLVQICDGTADNVEIQAALDALPSVGGSVLLSEGTFNIAATVMLRANITLSGRGMGVTTLKLANGANVPILQDNSTTASYITVRDLTIDGNGANQTGSSLHGLHLGQAVSGRNKSALRVLNVEAKSCRGSGILIYGASDVMVDGCRATGQIGAGGTQGIGIMLVNCADSVISSFYCQGNGRAGIQTANHSLTPGTNRITIGPGKSINHVRGIEHDDGDRVTIEGVDIVTASECAIGLFGNHHIVRGCHIDVTTTGVLLNSNTSVLAYGNRFENVNLAFQTLGNSKLYEFGNVGVPTQANHRGSGVATIANGATSVTVSHVCPVTPAFVLVTGTHAEVADAYVTGITASQFVINVPSAVTADRQVYWQIVP